MASTVAKALPGGTAKQGHVPRIREHVQSIKFGFARINLVRGPKRLIFRPICLPLALDVFVRVSIVSFGPIGCLG